jgi:CRISPR/Cas system-associated exonuclease Cas4 (RecB family)
MHIEHISVSRSKCYLLCPKQYKFKYHDKIPIPGEEPFYFVYGKVIHKIAEVYVEQAGNKTIGEVQTEVLRGKIEIENGKCAPPIPIDYKRRMPGHLKSIQHITEKMGFEGHLEYPFRYDLDPPHQKLMVGFIDRLLIKNDKAIVLDYKTTKPGKFRVNADTVKQDLQLRAYARVVNREFGIPAQNITCMLYYLEGGNLIGAKYTEQSLLDTEKELLCIYNSIVEHNPDTVRGNVGPHCQRCEYKSMCPFFTARGGKAESWDGNMEGLGWI